jgi:hypothetical protein
LSWALGYIVSDKSEILTKQQQNLVHYCSKGNEELTGWWLGLFVDNVPVAENWMLGMCDVADCINDGRDPETIRFLEFQNSKT